MVEKFAFYRNTLVYPFLLQDIRLRSDNCAVTTDTNIIVVVTRAHTRFKRAMVAGRVALTVIIVIIIVVTVISAATRMVVLWYAYTNPLRQQHV